MDEGDIYLNNVTGSTRPVPSDPLTLGHEEDIEKLVSFAGRQSFHCSLP